MPEIELIRRTPKEQKAYWQGYLAGLNDLLRPELVAALRFAATEAIRIIEQENPE